jgi:hypothetical protein
VGPAEGATVGSLDLVVGKAVGPDEGMLVGNIEGTIVGRAVGATDWPAVRGTVGTAEGTREGASVGILVAAAVGAVVGAPVGPSVGNRVGCPVASFSTVGGAVELPTPALLEFLTASRKVPTSTVLASVARSDGASPCSALINLLAR